MDCKQGSVVVVNKVNLNKFNGLCGMFYIVENVIYILINMYIIHTFYSVYGDSTAGGGIQIFYMFIFLPLSVGFAKRTSIFFEYQFSLSSSHAILLFILILLPSWLLIITVFLPDYFDMQWLFNCCSIISFFIAPVLYVSISGAIIYLNLCNRGIFT